MGTRINEPQRICSESAEDHAIEVALQQNEVEKFKEIYNAANIISKEFKKLNKWKFLYHFMISLHPHNCLP